MQDADEDFSMLLKLPPGYPLADLYALSERLAGTEVCVPGYSRDVIDYHCREASDGRPIERQAAPPPFWRSSLADRKGGRDRAGS